MPLALSARVSLFARWGVCMSVYECVCVCVCVGVFVYVCVCVCVCVGGVCTV